MVLKGHRISYECEAGLYRLHQNFTKLKPPFPESGLQWRVENLWKVSRCDAKIHRLLIFS
jgi:hypothetical protein